MIGIVAEALVPLLWLPTLKHKTLGKVVAYAKDPERVVWTLAVVLLRDQRPMLKLRIMQGYQNEGHLQGA